MDIKQITLDSDDVPEEIRKEFDAHVEKYGGINVVLLSEKAKQFVSEVLSNSPSTVEISAEEVIVTFELLERIINSGFIEHALICKDCSSMNQRLFDECSKYVTKYLDETRKAIDKNKTTKH